MLLAMYCSSTGAPENIWSRLQVRPIGIFTPWRGLCQELIIALPKALRALETVVAKRLSIQTDSGVQLIDLTVYPVQEPESIKGMAMIVFSDVETPLVKPKRRQGKASPSGTKGASQASEKCAKNWDFYI